MNFHPCVSLEAEWYLMLPYFSALAARGHRLSLLPPAPNLHPILHTSQQRISKVS